MTLVLRPALNWNGCYYFHRFSMHIHEHIHEYSWLPWFSCDIVTTRSATEGSRRDTRRTCCICNISKCMTWAMWGKRCLLLLRNTWSHFLQKRSTLPKENYTTIYASPWTILNAALNEAFLIACLYVWLVLYRHFCLSCPCLFMFCLLCSYSIAL